MPGDGAEPGQRKVKSGYMRRPPPQLPSLKLIRQILHREKPTDNTALKPTGRYLVSARAAKRLGYKFPNQDGFAQAHQFTRREQFDPQHIG
jgi:hypothetical protein